MVTMHIKKLSLLNKFYLSAPWEMYRNSMENVHTGVRVERVNNKQLWGNNPCCGSYRKVKESLIFIKVFAIRQATLTTKQPGDLSTLSDGFLLAKPWLSPPQLLHFVELTWQIADHHSKLHAGELLSVRVRCVSHDLCKGQLSSERT